MNAFVFVDEEYAIFVPVNGLDLAYVEAFTALVTDVDVVSAFIPGGNLNRRFSGVSIFEENFCASLLASLAPDAKLRF
jgi:predicted ATP-grasp superfamily ATP-dependent carboligase